MKSNNNQKKSLKTSRKTALPLLALFAGGQGLASSRNPLSLQSSKKMAGKSVVYVQIDQLPHMPVPDLHQQKHKPRSPFAAFSHKNNAQTQVASKKHSADALEFLRDNDLLSVSEHKTSHISGNTLSRKTFADDWQWSTRIPNPATRLSHTSNCTGTNVGTYNGALITGIYAYRNTGFSVYLCVAFLDGVNNVTVSSTVGSAILGSCQAMHMACDGQPLPVELMKFEVE